MYLQVLTVTTVGAQNIFRFQNGPQHSYVWEWLFYGKMACLFVGFRSADCSLLVTLLAGVFGTTGSGGTVAEPRGLWYYWVWWYRRPVASNIGVSMCCLSIIYLACSTMAHSTKPLEIPFHSLLSAYPGPGRSGSRLSRAPQASFSPATLSSSSWGIPRRSQARRDM